jgi:hypothetical protein
MTKGQKLARDIFDAPNGMKIARCYLCEDWQGYSEREAVSHFDSESHAENERDAERRHRRQEALHEMEAVLRLAAVSCRGHYSRAACVPCRAQDVVKKLDGACP